MKVQCPQCKAAYQIPDTKIPDKGAYARCPKCQTRFLVRKAADSRKTPLSQQNQMTEKHDTRVPKSQQQAKIAAQKQEKREWHKPPPRRTKPYLVAVLVIAVVLLAAFSGYFYASPYLTLRSIKKCVESGDAEQLSENVDFPILRKNLKEQLKVEMLKKTAKDLKDNPFKAFGVALASKFVDGIVETLVTPSGLTSLMEGKSKQTEREEEKKQPRTSKRRSKDLFPNASTGYDSLSKFSVRVPHEKGGEIRFVLTRSGLKWKLSNIVIPMNAVTLRDTEEEKKVKKIQKSIDKIRAHTRELRNEIRAKKGIPPLPNGCELEIVDWSWEKSSSSYVTAKGLVENVTFDKMKNVQVIVKWYDGAGRMITYGSAFLEYNPILNWQESPWSVMEAWNPKMKSATVEFKHFSGRKIPSCYVRGEK